MDVRLLQVIQRIEDDPFGDWSLERTAEMACYSPFHFHRVFKAATGVTLGRFVRSLQMHTAAKFVVREDRVEDIAHLLNYSSPGAFSRSFKHFTGASPSAFRQRPTPFPLQSDHEVVFAHAIPWQRNGDGKMEGKLLEILKPITVVGVQVETSPPADLNITVAWNGLSAHWTALTKKGAHPRVFGLEEYTVTRERSSGIAYTACVEVADGTSLPEGTVKRTIPAGKYAVFTHVGPTETLDRTFGYIYAEGLAALGVAAESEFDIEVYDDRFKEGSPDSEIDIYVPVEIR